jgi:hypothetical protein
MMQEPTEPPLEITMEFKDLLRMINYWKGEAMGFKHQMEVNLRCADYSDDALKEIALMLGWKPDCSANCIGAPPEDIRSTAVRLVREKLK